MTGDMEETRQKSNSVVLSVGADTNSYKQHSHRRSRAKARNSKIEMISSEQLLKLALEVYKQDTGKKVDHNGK